MSKLFMYGTPLGEIEQLMTVAPNFSPRKSGIVINNYFNCEGGGAKCSCHENIKGFICYADIYLYLNEREIDEIKYKDLIRDCFSEIKNYFLKDRLKHLTNTFKGELFLSSRYKERFYNELNKLNIDIEDISPRYIATLFLITADDMLWKVLGHSVRSDRFDFSQVQSWRTEMHF